MFALFKWQALFSEWYVFIEGFGITILVSFISLLFTLGIGFTGGLIKATGNKAAIRFVSAYESFFQNTPLVVQVFFLYNVLPYAGCMLSPFACGCIGLSLYTGAFCVTIVESSIRAVPKGQFEAAYSQGFGFMRAMFHIILPQAMKIAIPPLTNQAVNLIKNSSVLAMIAGGDLMYRADGWASGNLYYGPSFIVTGLLYLALCLPLSKFALRLERKNTGIRKTAN
ncbi:MAG: amino acid ABC transporter permease [Treponema sp.]|jgi:putative glutamine transport system permease protein|nr:amino acid ABC transporter permease [Treponema sp.]